MTDSILRSYYNVSSSTFVPFAAVFQPFASDLLSGETQGYAIDAATYDTSTAAAYVGGPVGGTVAVIDTGTPSNNLDDVPLDASNLIQAGTSPKMVHFPTSPYVRWSPHNLCLQSQTLGTTWAPSNLSVTGDTSVSPDGTTTADTFTVSGAGAAGVRQDITTVVGFVYTASCYFKQGVEDWVAFYIGNAAGTEYAGSFFDIANGVPGTSFNATMTLISKNITSVGSGWYRCDVTAAATQTTTRIFIDVAEADNDSVCGAGDTIIVWGVQFVRGYNANPYLATTTTARIGIPQSYDAAAARYGILVEPAATNLLVRSEELDVTWQQSGSGVFVDITANATTAPDGATTADKVIASTDNDTHYIFQNAGSAAAHTFSTYAKAAGYNFVWLFKSEGTDRAAVFNLATGAYAGNGGISDMTSTSITSIGNDWYRVTATCTPGAAANWLIGVGNSTSVAAFAGDGVSGAYIWGAQLETGSVASSYVPTLGSSSTRAADVVSALDTTFPGSDTNNTIYLDYKPLDVGSGTRYGWAYWKDANNFYSLAGVTANPTMGNTNAGSPEFAVDLGTLVAGTRTQITIAAKGSDFDGSQDGAAPTAQGTATLTTAYTTLYLGTFGTTGSELNGYIYRMVIVPYQRETVNSDVETWRYNF